jgi:hypothetical protein
MWIAYLAIAASAMACALWAISKGKVTSRGTSFFRTNDPIRFWITTSIYLAMAFGFAALALQNYSN